MSPNDPTFQTHEELTLWKEGQELQRKGREGSHALRIRMTRDWTVYAIQVGVFVYAGGSAVGLWSWPPGPVTPTYVLVAMASSWIGTQLKDRPPPWISP